MKLRIPAARIKASRTWGLRILTALLPKINLGNVCNQANTMRSTGVHTICRLYAKLLSNAPKVILNVTVGLVSPKPDINDREAIRINITALKRETFL